MKNQILEIRPANKNKLKIFKGQLILSLLGIIITLLIFYYLKNDNLENEHYSKTLAQSSILSSVYQTSKTSESNIFCTLDIPALGINYAVFKEFSEELLMLSPCKFYGVELGQTGNIAIAGHNLDNHTFFSDLNKIELNDEIYLYSNTNKKYIYTVYDTFETSSNNLDVLNTKLLTSKELTLVTCNNSNKKRFIVKAFLKS